jgi:tRNA threonylcarbamoyladenosine biosynthesis protein TsaE
MSVRDHSGILESTVWASEADTQRFAQNLAQALLSLPEPAQALIELHGELGAGKTTFARHLLRALGVQGRIKSPTYGIVESYQVGPLRFSHLDFYRFNNPEEWEEAGLRDLFAGPGLKLVEWPERVAEQLPAADLQLFISSMPGPQQEDAPRQLRLRAGSASGRQLAHRLA